MRFAAGTPAELRCFCRALVETAGWQSRTHGIEIRFEDRPGGPATEGTVVFAMRPEFWRNLTAGVLARSLLHEIQHAIDCSTGMRWRLPRIEVDARAREAEVVPDEIADALAAICGLEFRCICT